MDLHRSAVCTATCGTCLPTTVQRLIDFLIFFPAAAKNMLIGELRGTLRHWLAAMVYDSS